MNKYLRLLEYFKTVHFAEFQLQPLSLALRNVRMIFAPFLEVRYHGIRKPGGISDHRLLSAVRLYH